MGSVAASLAPRSTRLLRVHSDDPGRPGLGPIDQDFLRGWHESDTGPAGRDDGVRNDTGGLVGE
jgi:hypothetical protein